MSLWIYCESLTSRSFHTDPLEPLLRDQQPQQVAHSPLYSKISWDHGWCLASPWAYDINVLNPQVSTWRQWATSNAGIWQTSCKGTEREGGNDNKTSALYNRTALNFPLPIYDILGSIFSHHQTQQSHTTWKLLLALHLCHCKINKGGINMVF